MRVAPLLALTASLLGLNANPALTQKGHHSSGPHPSGIHHSSSRGGHYSGGGSSSHKGGHYVNPRTGNHYGHRR